VKIKEMLVEIRCYFRSSKGRIGIEDSEESYCGIFGAVTEGLNEGEEEGGERMLLKRKEKLLGEGERGRTNGGNGAFESIYSEIQSF
jgi:hypothetical protein